MSLRLIEFIIPKSEDLEGIRDEVAKFPVYSIWQHEVSGNYGILRVLVSTTESGSLLDIMEKKYSGVKGFRVIIFPVEATIPRIDDEDESSKKSEEKTGFKFLSKIGKGISREELYADVASGARLTGYFIFLVFLSTIVASAGMLRDNVAVVIGAMVIAPLIGPNVSLALATTLGDISLLLKSIKTSIVGLIVALITSIIIGAFVEFDPYTPETISRTKAGVSDIILALASGSAAALSYTVGLPSAIIGVMVAVALLPPTVVIGLMLGAGYPELAMGALLLLLINIICVNLSGVMTFLVQGVRPLTWWESNLAKKSARVAIIFWTLALIVLFVLIYFMG